MAEIHSNDSTLMSVGERSTHSFSLYVLSVDFVVRHSWKKNNTLYLKTKCSLNTEEESVKYLHIIIPPKTVDCAASMCSQKGPVLHHLLWSGLHLKCHLFDMSSCLKWGSFIFREMLSCSLSELIYSFVRGRGWSNCQETLKRGEGKQGLPICLDDLPKKKKKILTSMSTSFAS